MNSPPEEDTEEVAASVPEHWMEDEDVAAMDVAYSSRSPSDWVSSGPLGAAAGNGRRFATWGEAERWARRFYGKRFKGRVTAAVDGGFRWAFLIRGRGEKNATS